MGAVIARCLPLIPRGPLGRVVFDVDLFGHGHDFVVIVVTAGRADMVRALEFAAGGAFAPIKLRAPIRGLEAYTFGIEPL